MRKMTTFVLTVCIILNNTIFINASTLGNIESKENIQYEETIEGTEVEEIESADDQVKEDDFSNNVNEEGQPEEEVSDLIEEENEEIIVETSEDENYESNEEYIINEAYSNSKSMAAEITAKTNVPTIEIETNNRLPIDSKEDYREGTMKIYGTDKYTTGLYNGTMKIRGRGNTTWGMPKKPYRIKLDSKSEILGMPSAKDWILLANFSDKSLMRTKLAFDFGKAIGLSYTSNSEFVNVIVNGEYVGNYLLCEQIEIGKSRINIKELSPTDTDENVITGGYLLEIDVRRDADVWFNSKKGVAISFKSPKQPNEQQLNYVKTYINDIEEALDSKDFMSNGKHYSDYIDVDSFVNWYLLNELFKNNDAAFFSSVYLYKDRDGKLCIGPIWDFDISAGNINYNGNDNPEGWWVRDSSWYKQLFRDPVFVEKVQARFKEIQPQIASMINSIDIHSDYLKESQKMNFTKWDILDKYVWPNACVTGSYEGEINYLKTWLNKRLNWMKENIHFSQEKIEGFVTSIYNVALNREPDSEGFNYWVNRLVEKDCGGRWILINLLSEPEFKDLNLGAEDYVSRMYTVIVGREPDAEGFKYWVDMYNDYIDNRGVSVGATRMALLSYMINEPEFKNVCINMGMAY